MSAFKAPLIRLIMTVAHEVYVAPLSLYQRQVIGIFPEQSLDEQSGLGAIQEFSGHLGT